MSKELARYRRAYECLKNNSERFFCVYVLYFVFMDGKASALKDLLGIGVRLEDDILISRNEDRTTGCEVLTESCPKSLQDIEELMNA